MSASAMINLPPATATAAPDSNQLYIGFIGCGVAAIFFGSNYVPVKKFKTGDGMFFQWILCIAIWCTGLVVHLIEGSPKFYPLAMLGGALWAAGNICVVPIFKTIGMAIGLLTWSAFNLLAGWASGRFGWFGLKAEIPKDPTLNYIGVSCALLSVFVYVAIKSEVGGGAGTAAGDAAGQDTAHRQRLDTMNDTARLVYPNDENSINPAPSHEHSDHGVTGVTGVTASDTEPSDATFLDTLSPKNKKTLGLVLSVISGIFYGVTFAPVIYIKDNYDGASDRDLEYVFSHFTGILLTSTALFIIYATYMQNRPRVYAEIILPAFVSGIMWAIAQCGWFVANQYLSEAISFPIITTLPGIVASLWGVIVFKEIRGRRNLGLLGLAFTFVITGSILSGLSKV